MEYHGAQGLDVAFMAAALADAVDGLEASIRRLDDNIRDLEDRLDLREQVLLQQFSRADQALQQLASLQSTIGSQLQSSLL